MSFDDNFKRIWDKVQKEHEEFEQIDREVRLLVEKKRKEDAGADKYGEEYRLYGERFDEFQRYYLGGYDLDGANIQKYEFTEPFEIPPNFFDSWSVWAFKDITEYTFWEKLTGKPEKDIERTTKSRNDGVNDAKKKHNEECSAANHLLRQSDYIVREIISLRIKAVDYLTIAEKEFSSNTFASFWQAIENAAPILEKMAFLVWGLSVKIRYDYLWKTSGFTNFPPFFFLEAIPDSTDLIEKYNKIVHQGFSNYEFASIWEARKTRKTIIGCFTSLESAVQGVGNTLQDGFANLNRQLESNARDQILATNIQTLVLRFGLKEKR